MDRIRHINTRNLVVCDTFDDFAKKVAQTDFLVEDVVGYVIDVTRVFYWLNVESIWGVIGFNWTQLNPIPDTEDYENVWEHLEHVNADGTNITEPRQVNPGMGYGTFARTTIPFNIIPKLPDGFRITAFNGTFDAIASDTLELQRSDWHNVKSLNNLCPPNKSLKADLIGAGGIEGITSATNLIRSGSNLYFMGDLSHIQANQYVLNNYGGTVTVDDNNEGWGIPYNSERLQFRYHYKGTKQARLEYLIDINHTTSRNKNDVIGITSDNNQIYIVNAPYNAGSGYPNVHMIPNKKATDYTDWHDLVAVPDEDKITLTIDYSHYNNTDTFSEHLIGGQRSWYTGDISDNDNSNFRRYMFNPIQYIGLPQDASIEAYNPHIVFANDNWPEYNQQIVEKTKQNATDLDNNEKGLFMPHIMAQISRKCPYTIDCSNISQLDFFNWGMFYIEDDTALVREGGLDILPTMTNMNLDMFSIGFGITGSSKYLYLPSIKAREFYLKRCAVVGANSIIETSNLRLGYSRDTGGTPFVYLEIADTTKTCIRLIPDDNNLMSLRRNHDISGITTKDANYNFIQYGTHDEDILKANTLVAFVPNKGYTIYHDLIACNMGTGNSGLNIDNINIESDFIFIYRSSVKMLPTQDYGRPIPDDEMTAYYNNQVKKIIGGLQPKGDTDVDYTFTMWRALVNKLTQAEKDYIQVTCGYRIINQDQ